jgi:hypothetical protein
MNEHVEIRRASAYHFNPWVIAALIMTAVLVNAADYSFLVPLRDVRLEAHQQVVAHTALAPARYRLLVPVALDMPIRALSGVMSYDKAFGRVYAVFYFAALATLLGLLVYELSLWFTLEEAMVGALLVGSTIRMALRQGEYLDLSSIPLPSVFAPHSFLEPVFVAAAIVLSVHDKGGWLVALVALASLNSEAAALLPLVYLAVRGVSRSSLKTTVALAVIWSVVFLAIRFAAGPSSSSAAAADLWRDNLAHLPTAALNVALFLGPLWVLAAIGARRAPAPIRRAGWLIPVHLSVVAVAGLWWDVRLLMALYPILVPLVVSAMFVPSDRAGGNA